MRTITLAAVNDFEEWRGAARRLLAAGQPPDTVFWRVGPGEDSLFEGGAETGDGGGAAPAPAGAVPACFLELARDALCHSDPERFGLLYRLLWRLQRERGLLEWAADPDVLALEGLTKAVRRDSHKMTAFVRFRSAGDGEGRERFAAWFEPEHFVLERTAPFFARRFACMDWAILTPYRSAFWDGEALRFGPGARREDVPAADALEEAWRAYFAAIFNPARLKVKAMTAEMPKKYWRNLPEAELIAPLIRGAQQSERAMIEKGASQPPSRHLKAQQRKNEVAGPEETGITSIGLAREAVQECRRCPLYEHATQAVFGEGGEDVQVMFVGEQPGDSEDLAGRPFIGPAGKVLNAVLEEVGIAREKVYVTNAVKHFKFTPRGKRRIHQKPSAGEVQACRFWLDHERALLAPKIVVALGATAAQAVLGRSATIFKLRAAPITLEDGTLVFVTVHPSYLLRIPEPERKDEERRAFARDLTHVAQAIAALAA